MLEESVAGFRDIEDTWGVAYALDRLASLWRDQGEYERALILHEESLALRRMLGDQQGIAVSLSNMADVARCQADWQRSISLHEKNLAGIRVLDELGEYVCLCHAVE
jgi:hypothetical protein